MEDLIKEVQNILNKGHVMSLGTIDEGGVWVADVVYIHDSGLNIYWISQISARHSVAITKKSQVVVTITTSTRGEPIEGLQILGEASEFFDATPEMLENHLHKEVTGVPHKRSFVENGKLVDPELSWYQLHPKKIELISQRLFGFEKQIIEMDKL